ncbi:isoprenyl transferase [Galactobacter caseinivorans]|uniref:Isoprenyl transferase n=1 Tax=Galactobacter caseinivorans TaxID=2676123 RepID=A0A496PJG2_9MICC|nr:isoprenyl transferase [Galactobacter caseinivorans]RKW70609.1 isoprenyl transferase [Galactobacter caseinivorans]
MQWPAFLYGLYERRLASGLNVLKLPRHIGVLVDGNRRWAKLAGAPTAEGHQAGADKIHEFLGWCRELGIQTVTLYMLSTDNLSRPSEELEDLLGIIENTLSLLGEPGGPRVQPVGAIELLPASLAAKLEELKVGTRDREDMHVNVAVGYGGRREIVDAVRSFLLEQAAAGRSTEQIAESMDAESISRHLYTSGQPDPDLLIRTSGEQRLSGFMTWQSAYSEFYFCEALWPDFRRVDFLRALRDFELRSRRFGG